MRDIRWKLSLKSLIIVFLYILQFIGMPYTSWYNNVKYILILCIGIYIFRRLKIIVYKKYLIVNIIMVVFVLLVILSSYINRRLVSGRNVFRAAIIFGAIFLEIFFAVEIFIEQGDLKKVLKLFRNCAIIEICICDFLLLLMHDFFWIDGINYLIGSKFSVMYTHLWTIMFILICRLLKGTIMFDFKVVSLIAWTGFISMRVDCVTGFVGLILFCLIVFLITSFKKYMINPIVGTGLLIFSFLFIFGYNLVLNIPIISDFIINVFGRQETMNSRLNIYNLTLLFLRNHLLLGLGYGSSYEIGMSYGQFANTQNSILEWIWQAGIPATIVMVSLIIFIFIKMGKVNYSVYSKHIYPIVALIYVYILIGSVEITMSNTFFALCAIGFAMAEDMLIRQENRTID